MYRIPRPQGATYLSKKYQESTLEEDKQALIRHLITFYTLQGFTWNGKPTSIPALAQILKLEPRIIMGHISEIGTNLGSLSDPKNIKNTLKSIIAISTTWAIQDRGQISQQLNLLLASQGSTYRPFVTSEVNQILKTLLSSNKNIIDAFKTFFTSTNYTTNILNVINPKEEQNESLTPDQALEIIKTKELPSKSYTSLPANNSALSNFAPLADELKEGYGVAELFQDRIKGSADLATRPFSEKGPIAIRTEGQEVTKPQGPDRDSFKRRGIDVEDVDEI